MDKYNQPAPSAFGLGQTKDINSNKMGQTARGAADDEVQLRPIKTDIPLTSQTLHAICKRVPRPKQSLNKQRNPRKYSIAIDYQVLARRRCKRSLKDDCMVTVQISCAWHQDENRP
jgi:hypothetical protein